MATWPVLFGQIAAGGTLEPSGPKLSMVLMALVGCVGLIVGIGVPVVLGIRSDARRREMEHLERMRAIELGRPLAIESGWWTPAKMAVGIGIGVPIGVFAIGVKAAELSGAAPFVWPSAGAVGVAAVICGTVLAARSSMNPPTGSHAKPYVHPDMYDAAEHQHS
ncbi:hypothetical protein AB1L88_24635 [Tautonia sp. JC769]|uniref:hypothetical protein n=1 Tax=Tautonia sp. JC769 TaxID=3232135 RepID=UPI00345AB255